MKVEKSITIEGNKVVEEYSNDLLTIYKATKDSYGYTCYFVNNETGEVFLKVQVMYQMLTFRMLNSEHK